MFITAQAALSGRIDYIHLGNIQNIQIWLERVGKCEQKWKKIFGRNTAYFKLLRCEMNLLKNLFKQNGIMIFVVGAYLTMNTGILHEMSFQIMFCLTISSVKRNCPFSNSQPIVQDVYLLRNPCIRIRTRRGIYGQIYPFAWAYVTEYPELSPNTDSISF